MQLLMQTDYYKDLQKYDNCLMQHSINCHFIPFFAKNIKTHKYV